MANPASAAIAINGLSFAFFRFLELASRDASNLTDEQAIADLLIFAERYKRSYMKLIPLFTRAAQDLKTKMLMAYNS